MTLIAGFGFLKPHLMRVKQGKVGFELIREEDVAKVLADMRVYSDAEQLSLPLYVLKTGETKLPLMSIASALDHLKRLFERKGPF
jgi:hypothetical protein